MQVKHGSTAAALALCLALASPSGAANAAGPELKAEIDGLLDKLEANTHGLLKWDGADRMEIRQDGDAAVADIANARISIGSPEAKPGATRSRVSFDYIEIRRARGPEGSVNLSAVFPREAILRTADGGETKLALKDATATAIIDGQSGRARTIDLAFAEARIDDKATGDWLTFGPLSLSSKVIGAADGGWTAPIDVEMKQIEFFFTEGPVGGAIDRIAYSARSAGPDLAALNRLRDRADQLRQEGGRQEGDSPPAARLDALIDLLPTIPSLFSLAKGELTVEGVAVRAPTGEPYVAIAKANMGGALTGLSGDAEIGRAHV